MFWNWLEFNDILLNLALRKHDVCFLVTCRSSAPVGTKFNVRQPFKDQIQVRCSFQHWSYVYFHRAWSRLKKSKGELCWIRLLIESDLGCIRARMWNWRTRRSERSCCRRVRWVFQNSFLLVNWLVRYFINDEHFRFFLIWILSRLESYEKKPQIPGDLRKYRVWLDPNQYRVDMESRADKNTEDIYYTFNIFVRRDPKTNNFKVHFAVDYEIDFV